MWIVCVYEHSEIKIFCLLKILGLLIGNRFLHILDICIWAIHPSFSVLSMGIKQVIWNMIHLKKKMWGILCLKQSFFFTNFKGQLRWSAHISEENLTLLLSDELIWSSILLLQSILRTKNINRLALRQSGRYLPWESGL